MKIDFAGIGVPRAGTTWVYQCLKEHPEVCVSEKKETHFFLDDNLFDKGVAYYKRFYKDCGDKIKGEFDPGYFYDPRVLRRIKTFSPEVKIIVCLREPKARAKSHLLKHSLKGKIINHQLYISSSLYSRRLEGVFEIFGKDNVFIIIFDDIENNPLSLLRGLYSFLGVDNNFVPPSASSKIKPTGEARAKSKMLNVMLYRGKRFIRDNLPFLARLMRELGLSKLRSFLLRVNMTETGKTNVKNEADINYDFSYDIARVEKLLGRKLNWR